MTTNAPSVTTFFRVSMTLTDTTGRTGQTKSAGDIAATTTAQKNHAVITRYQAPELVPVFDGIDVGGLTPHEFLRSYQMPEASYFVLGGEADKFRWALGRRVTFVVEEVHTKSDRDSRDLNDAENVYTVSKHTNIGELYVAESDEVDPTTLDTGTRYRQKCPTAAKQDNDMAVIEQWRLLQMFVERNGVDEFKTARMMQGLPEVVTPVV